MILSIKIIMSSLMIWLFSCVVGAKAAEIKLEGTWQFEHSSDFFGRTPDNKTPGFSTLSIKNEEVVFSETCFAKFTTDDYLFSDVFQPLTKQGISKKQIDVFLAKNFNISLLKVKTIYSLVPSSQNCARPIMEFFFVDNKILVPVGATFFSYVKKSSEKNKNFEATSVIPKWLTGTNYKFSHLPLDFDSYYSTCKPKIFGPKGKLQTTEKCASDYFPYIANPSSDDSLMRIIGNHSYSLGGHEYNSGFSTPFKQKIAATFLVFPPMKQVVLVRVDDFEAVRNEERDVMTGVYLSIVDGKIVDQISGCHFNGDYVCVDEERQVAKLTSEGKFVRQ